MLRAGSEGRGAQVTWVPGLAPGMIRLNNSLFAFSCLRLERGATVPAWKGRGEDGTVCGEHRAPRGESVAGNEGEQRGEIWDFHSMQAFFFLKSTFLYN